jgi:alpha-beta hydrolase superfamily lysophospholipase
MKLVRDEGLRFDRRSEGPPLYWSWTAPERPTAALLILPGYGDHAWRYRHVLPRWAAAGIASLVVDFRGHGRSGGIRGFGRSVGDFLSDARIGREMLRNLAPSVPHFVFGHSHGGLVATHVALEDQNPWAGVVLSAPYFDLRFPVPAVKRLAGEIAAIVAPTFGIPSGMTGLDVVRDTARAAEYDDDPLGFEVVRTGWFVAARRAQSRARRHARELALPMYCVFGTDDRIARIEAAKAVFDAAKSRDKTFDVRADYRHVPLADLDWEPVADTIAQWIVTRAPARLAGG